jgi:hypothetical protein
MLQPKNRDNSNLIIQIRWWTYYIISYDFASQKITWKICDYKKIQSYGYICHNYIY